MTERKMCTTLFVILSIIYSVNLQGQLSKTDSLIAVLSAELSDIERAATLHILGPRFINSDPDSALLLAEQAFDITLRLDDFEIHSTSYRRMGHALYVVGDWDRFRSSLLSYVDFADEHEDYFQVAASYRNLSKIGEATKQPDSSLFYLDKCIEVLAEHPDSVILIDVYLSKGLTYKYKGYYEMSIEALLNGVRVAEAIDSKGKLGYLDMNLGITYHTMERDEKSAFHMKKSIDYFVADGNTRGQTRSTSNLGFAYMKLERLDEAQDEFEKAIELAKETSMPNIAMHSYIGLANIAHDKEDFQRSLGNVIKAEEIAKEIGEEFTIGAALRFKAKLALKQNNPVQARSYIKAAEQHVAAYREPLEESEYHFEMAALYEGVGRYKDALQFTNNGNALEDSVYTLKKEQQFAELNLIYETEKKDAEIQLLNKQTELDASRKRTLWIALAALALVAISTIYAIIQRKRKKEAILIQQREAASRKLELANQQLEFKKKELTAKVLQLASKNEFLSKLEEEVNALKSSVDTTIQKTSGRISRMIKHDADDDSEWDQFSKEFSSVHQGFIDQIVEKYGALTKSEVRLVSLLKMNLSSKEIANILRVSDEGIKKARYRLRKKMGLESNDDLQGVLLSM